MEKNSRIYVAGHTGLAGSAILRGLEDRGYENIVTASHKQLDLRDGVRVELFFCEEEIEYVFLAAAHAGGISEAVNKPAEMLSDNIRIQTNVIDACKNYDVKKLLFMGSSCIYPVNATQPYKEEDLGSGKTDENWSYAIAKLTGIEMCRAYHRQYGCNFITVNPCNLYGTHDNFGENGHVIPSWIRKFHEGDTVTIWGDWNRSYFSPMREFLYSDDMADAVIMLMEKYNYDDLCDGVINVGVGYDTELRTVLTHLERIIGERKIVFDTTKPGGVKSKLLDVARINELGWHPMVNIFDGLKRVNDWYVDVRGGA